MSYFVNLPISWAVHEEKWLHKFIGMGLNPELGLDEHSLALPVETHREIAARLEDAGLKRALHLPFMHIDPGAEDSAARGKARSALLKGAEIAELYGAKHMIGHAAICLPDAECGTFGQEYFSARMGRLGRVWETVNRASSIPLFLENTYEQDPGSLAHFIAGLDQDTRLCFDVGHWFSFGGGKQENNLEFWLSTIGAYIQHLHLHDNDGASDAHLALGGGGIAFEEYFRLLNQYCGKISITLEPHDENALNGTINWFRSHGEARADLMRMVMFY